MPFHSGCGWLSSSLAPSTLRRSRLNPLNFGRIHKEIWASLDLPPWIPNERAHINTAQYRLRGHRGCVNCLALAPDGSLLLSAGDDTLLGVWSPWSFINRECAAFALFDQQEPPIDLPPSLPRQTPVSMIRTDHQQNIYTVMLHDDCAITGGLDRRICRMDLESEVLVASVNVQAAVQDIFAVNDTGSFLSQTPGPVVDLAPGCCPHVILAAVQKIGAVELDSRLSYYDFRTLCGMEDQTSSVDSHPQNSNLIAISNKFLTLTVDRRRLPEPPLFHVKTDQPTSNGCCVIMCEPLCYANPQKLDSRHIEHATESKPMWSPSDDDIAVDFVLPSHMKRSASMATTTLPTDSSDNGWWTAGRPAMVEESSSSFETGSSVEESESFSESPEVGSTVSHLRKPKQARGMSLHGLPPLWSSYHVNNIPEHASLHVAACAEIQHTLNVHRKRLVPHSIKHGARVAFQPVTGSLLLVLRMKNFPLVYSMLGFEQYAFPVFELRSEGLGNDFTMKNPCWLSDGTSVAIGSEDSNIHVWHLAPHMQAVSALHALKSTEVLWSDGCLGGHRSVVNSIVAPLPYPYYRGPPMIASSGIEKCVRLWTPSVQPADVPQDYAYQYVRTVDEYQRQRGSSGKCSRKDHGVLSPRTTIQFEHGDIHALIEPETQEDEETLHHFNTSADDHARQRSQRNERRLRQSSSEASVTSEEDSVITPEDDQHFRLIPVLHWRDTADDAV
ncbi:MAG: uncharacterized protein KVP18_004560 [Porospora cf. gigantea A]|uniref:uncharacterized protein n=1 Tax=Porospora cf. gigantea A TaxID=2853593 RepID=UPI00355AA29A|nr:MAG: hypothetical protein KVP18_004560 [Porospora cf. gigantea A]